MNPRAAHRRLTTSRTSLSRGERWLSAPLLAAPLLAFAISGCVVSESELDEEDLTGEAEEALSGRDVGFKVANPNAQLTGKWLLTSATAKSTEAEFTSPISTPDGRLTLSHVKSTTAGVPDTFALGVILPPRSSADSGNYAAATGTVNSKFLDSMLARDANGDAITTPITLPSGGYQWIGNTSEQMGLGTDPRLASGNNLRVASANAEANCFAADPGAVTFTPSGPYECRRYLLFMPGKGADGAQNRIHMAQIGVILNAYSAQAPSTRLATPTIVSAKFLSGFTPMLAKEGSVQGALMGPGIELSVTADSRLQLHNTGVSFFTFNETPWDPTTWSQRRSLTCLATPTGTVCPGVKLTVGQTCATNPEKCGIADKQICTSGRDGAGVCLGPTMAFRDKYPIAAYPLRGADGAAYQGVTNAAGVVQPAEFGGGYGWVSFDGSEFVFNGSHRSVRSIFGKATRGVLKHIDNQAAVASARYCTLGPLNVQQWYTRQNGGADTCTEGDGMRQTQPLGMGGGLWRFAPEVKDALLPLSRRGPLFMLIDHNQLLGNYGPAGAPAFNQSVAATEHRYRHIYSEVALDDFSDGDFVAYYHMNELVRTNTDRTDIFDYGKTPDTSGNFYTGQIEGGAQLPIQRAGLTDLAGQVNPGYLGRAVFLPQAGAVRVPRPASGGPLAGSLTAFSIELALKPLTAALWAANTTTTIAEMPGFWKLTVLSDASANFYPRLTMYKSADGTATTMGNVGAALPKSTAAWTHLGVTVDLSVTGDRKVRFYVNGALKQTTLALPAVATAVPAAQTNLLVLGPNGTGPAGDSFAIDEVAISRRVRDAEYMAAAAFAAPTLNFNVEKSTTSQGPYLFSDTGVLPTAMLGLSADDLRVPQTLLDKIALAKALTGDTWKARFEKIRDLGNALFNDDLLTVKWSAATSAYVESKDARACATCHVSGQARAHQGVAFDKDILGGNLPVNSPTSLNRAFARKHFFDQRSPDLVDQVLRPIENAAVLEMGGDATNIASFINGLTPSGTAYSTKAGATVTGAADGYPAAAPARPAGVTTYLDWFRYAFGNGAADTVNVPVVDRSLLAYALAAFTLSQAQGNSVVDRVRAGQTAAAIVVPQSTYDAVVRGLRVFEGKGRCTACHSGSTYTDESTHASGPSGVPTKTPTLRKIAVTGPYFRDASKATLADVVSHYNAGGFKKSDPLAANGQVTGDAELYPLGLTAAEQADLVTFLQNL